jgi:bacteriocin biosynthesis cyclodehydratase domain-containing protein
MIPALPYLAPWYRLVSGEDALLAEWGQRIVRFEGSAATRLLPALLPLLDGTRTLDEIAALLGEPVRPAIEQALRQLHEHDLLLPGPPAPDDLPPGVAATVLLLTSLASGNRAPAETAASLSSSTVSIVGDGTPGAEIGRLLRRSGTRVERSDAIVAGNDLVVCAPAPTELPRLGSWNEQALAAQQPWLQVLPFDGRYAAIGPLYLPGDTCCYECFRIRRAANLDAGDELALLDSTPAPYPDAPSLDAVVAGLATMLVLGWLLLADHYAPAAFYALDLFPVLALAVHYVHRVPRCRACSGLADVAAPLPWHKEIPVVGG